VAEGGDASADNFGDEFGLADVAPVSTLAAPAASCGAILAVLGVLTISQHPSIVRRDVRHTKLDLQIVDRASHLACNLLRVP
jgi:hypothetical protein